jgi:hypothetical protein
MKRGRVRAHRNGPLRAGSPGRLGPPRLPGPPPGHRTHLFERVQIASFKGQREYDPKQREPEYGHLRLFQPWTLRREEPAFNRRELSFASANADGSDRSNKIMTKCPLMSPSRTTFIARGLVGAWGSLKDLAQNRCSNSFRSPITPNTDWERWRCVVVTSVTAERNSSPLPAVPST